MQFSVKIIKNLYPEIELKKIGFDESYLNFAQKKYKFLTLKVEDIPPHLSAIIKETALSKGTDAALNKKVLFREVDFSSLILSGSVKQIEEIAKSLLLQPFGLKKIGEDMLLLCESVYAKKSLKIMGILNVTLDSFSDGGKYFNLNDAIAHGVSMIKEGADIIDIGGESTRPNAHPVEVQEEIKRVIPVIKELKNYGAVISCDTRNSKTAALALEAGASIINDVSGLNYDKDMISVIKNASCDVVLNHSKGTPDVMDNLAVYGDVCKDVYNKLRSTLNYALEAGVKKEKIIIDPGFGFAKNEKQNLELLTGFYEFNSLGTRIMAGVSRKRFLKGFKYGEFMPDEATMLCSFYLFENGADIVRVHDVKKTKLALDIYKKLYSPHNFGTNQP